MVTKWYELAARAKNRVQILLVPMASCAHVPRPKCQDSDLHRPMAWFPAAYVLRALSWAHGRVWGAAGRGCHATAWPVICALCVFSLCKSCFIRDIDLCGPMAWFPGAYVLRALSWVHVRVWGAARRGCRTPAWPGSAHLVCFPYVNRALFGTSSSADRWPPCWPCMPCARYVGPLGASWGPPTAAVTRPDDRGVRVWHVQNAKSRFMLPMHSMGGTWSHGV